MKNPKLDISQIWTGNPEGYLLNRLARPLTRIYQAVLLLRGIENKY